MGKSLTELVKERKENGAIHRKKRSDEEHDIQCACVRWFARQHKDLRGRLFAVPNGGKRDPITAEKLLEEGVIAGVSDLILLKPNSKYCALLIEMKTPKGKQSSTQKKWQTYVCSEGEYKYVLCRSKEDFIHEVDEYLKG